MDTRLFSSVFRLLLTTILISRCSAEIVVTESPSDTIVALGFPAVFHCLGQNNPHMESLYTIVEWKHNNVVITPGGRFHVFSNGTLDIKWTEIGDAGNYSCKLTIEDAYGVVKDTQILPAAWLYFAFLDDIFYQPTNMTVVDLQSAPAYFQCITGDSLPLATISWEKDGVPLVDDQNNVVIYSSQFGDQNSLKVSGTLQINNVRSVHAGQYRCVVTNPYLPDHPARSWPATLTVGPNPGAPYVSLAPTSQIVAMGQAAIFPCVILGDPAPAITWRQEGAAANIANSTEVQVLLNGSLRFSSVTQAQEGSYVCTGTSMLGTVSAPSVTLFSASMDWSFVIEPTDLDVLEGSPSTFFCRPPFSRPTANVTWYKDSLLYTPRTGAQILSEGDLYFSAAMKSDEGVYFCVASNDFIPRQVTSQSATFTVSVGTSIVSPPNSTEVVLGNELSLTCVAEGDPAPIITWSKDGRQLTADERTTIGSSGLLHIRNIVAIDEGTYRCESTNLYNTATASAFVNVLIPPQITASPGEVTVGQGSQTTITCTVIGDPIPTVSWFKDDMLLQIDPSDPSNVQTNAGLVISDAQPYHAGSYRCQAESSVGTAESTGTLVVWTVPEFIVEPENQTALEYMVVTFQCNATGTPAPSLSWLFNEGALPSWASVDEEGRRLNVPNALSENTGKYTCVATNAQGSARVEAYLDVLVEPSVTPLPNLTLEAGQQLIVTCQASGHPDPTYTWLNDQDPLQSRGRVSLTNTGVLTIAELSKSDQGWYSCVASNSVGNGRETFYLTIVDVPGQPTLLEAYPLSATSVHLAWIAGGDVVDTAYYQVQYRLSTSQTWLTYVDNLEAMAGNQTYMLHSLEENQEYQVRVVAKNAVGQTPSTMVVVMTPSVTGPSAPRNVRVTSYNGTSISLVWEVPADRNGPIEIYMVEYHITGTMDFMIKEIPGGGQATITAMVSDLRPLTSYQLRVSGATLHKGLRQPGNYSDYLEQTTGTAAPDGAPSNLTLEVSSSTSITASWEPIPALNQNGAITGYMVLYRLSESLEDFVMSEAIGAATSYLLTGLSPWTTYEVKVQGVNGDGVGPSSDSVVAKTLADAPTDVPQNVSLSTVNKTSISVTWEPVPESGRNGLIDGYTVFYRAAGVSGFSESHLAPTETSLIITDLDVAQEYQVQVLAFNLVNGVMKIGPRSAIQSIPTADGLPGPVVGLTAYPHETSIRLRWNPPVITNGLIQGYAIKYVSMQRNNPTTTTATTQATPTETTSPSPFTTPYEEATAAGAVNRTRRQTVNTFTNETHGIIETAETSHTLTDLLAESRYWVGVISKTSAGFSPDVVSIYVITGKLPPTLGATTPAPTITTTNATIVTSSFDTFFDLFNLPKTSLILFLSIIGVGFLAIILAIAVFSAWCSGRRSHPRHIKRKATLWGSMPSDDVIMADHSHSASNSVCRSHSPSASSGLAASTELPSTAGTTPMIDSQPLIHDSGSDNPDYSDHSDPSRPRASSSPASAQHSVRAIPPPLTLPATASVNLYPTAPNPRNGRLNTGNDLLDTSPAGLEALYSRVNRSNLQAPSRLKKDSLAAIAVLLDQEENESDLRPLDSPPSVVISNQRTTL
ncbi:Down syndrome cell adhesion molecule-like protein 1 homolog isoform X2 [Lytechinus variegatus]|uniref:Down syndrome cell adhesion molecule-like protein 1 homolog isoform X2 n=1 Tax=Lytechinus variegatus TaxID=7654 RepID=UPI001BB237F5|nr:Down syndrome cell adhesion molecule-like protein 1 homolog isoform X2 [Lytechinus variegatus]